MELLETSTQSQLRLKLIYMDFLPFVTVWDEKF